MEAWTHCDSKFSLKCPAGNYVLTCCISFLNACKAISSSPCKLHGGECQQKIRCTGR